MSLTNSGDGEEPSNTLTVSFAIVNPVQRMKADIPTPMMPSSGAVVEDPKTIAATTVSVASTSFRLSAAAAR